MSNELDNKIAEHECIKDERDYYELDNEIICAHCGKIIARVE